MKIVNMTPHDVVVVLPSGKKNTYPKPTSKSYVARVDTEEQEWLADLDDKTPLFEPQRPKGITLMVAEADRDADAIIVSMMAADYLLSRHTTDFVAETNLTTSLADIRILAPDTGPTSAIRDAAGHPAGVRRLVDYTDQ